MHTAKTTGKDNMRILSRTMYTLFVVLSAYYLFFRGDYGDAAANLGIALIFDPFNPQQSWKDRPLYQRVWLIVHVILVCIMFALQFSR
jgi:hypothetical protein